MNTYIDRLRCENLDNPNSVERVKPRLSWVLESRERNILQLSYRILVASSAELLSLNNGDLWDTGVVKSSQQNQVIYGGKALGSFQECFWKVILEVSDGAEFKSEVSGVSFWKMGVLDMHLWCGAYISAHCEGVKDATYCRKVFTVGRAIKSAYLYATAKGIYDLYINGRQVSHEFFSPGWTDYRQYIYYRTYDVKDMLVEGDNCLGGILNDGWFKGAIGFRGDTCIYGSRIMILMNLRIEYTDGSVETIATDKDFRVTYGPILQSSFLYGENYDARMELKDWSEASYDDSEWRQADVHEFDKEFWSDGAAKMITPNLNLHAHPAPPVRPVHEFVASDMWSSMPGSYIFDLGRNFAGFVRIKVKGKPGQMIRLRFAEVLNSDRSLYVENLRSAFSTDTYICKGMGEEVWEPKFTFHGFQYVEVTGIDNPSLDTVVGVAIGTDIERVGSFRCSNADINMLYANTYWTQRANFIEVPTDCPQRDERLGWTGDALAFVRTAAYNTDISTFFSKWLKDLRDTAAEDGSIANVAPSVVLDSLRGDAAWADAIIGCPWAMYEFYGDKTALFDNYDAMKRFIEYYKASSDNLIRSRTHCFGDWLSHNADTPKEVIQTAFFAHSTNLFAKIASILGFDEDAEKYSGLAEDVKSAFNQAFVDSDGRVKGNTQTAYILVLAFDLVSDELKEKALEYLVEDIESRGNRLSTGFIGTSMLMPTLSKYGRTDVAYRLLLQEGYPSWLFPIRNGATSIWERWNGWTPENGPGDSSMNSYSHYSFGAVVEWMYCVIGGISMLKPGFEEVKIAPEPGGGLKWAECSYWSIRGKIVSNWRIENDIFHLDVEIPSNTRAEVMMPGVIEPTGDAHVVEDLRIVDGKSSFIIGSGVYSFRATDVI